MVDLMQLEEARVILQAIAAASASAWVPEGTLGRLWARLEFVLDLRG